VIGLGNPGKEYAATRHNVGHWCIDRLAELHSAGRFRRSRLAEIAEATIGGQRVVLAKPRTYVNESGRAVTSLMTKYRAAPGDLLIVYDEMDLPAGSIRLRARGGSGGHNGMKSIIDATGTQEFPRLRIGVGRPARSGGEVEHVLGSMPGAEKASVDDAVSRAADAIETVLRDGVVEAMNRFNVNPSQS
jgi:PTH1 family peptidyl-tRNA hydrolase